MYVPRNLAGLVRLAGLQVHNPHGTALAIALGGVGTLLALSYLPGRLEFEALCIQTGDPIIERRVTTHGFLYSRTHPYDAQRQLSQRKIFSYVEIPDQAEEGAYLRIARRGSRWAQDRRAKPSSRYGVLDIFEDRATGVKFHQKVIYELHSGEELAHAADIGYSGGPLSLLIGMAGRRSSCLNLMSERGSRNFQIYYDLESIVLGGQEIPEGLRWE